MLKDKIHTFFLKFMYKLFHTKTLRKLLYDCCYYKLDDMQNFGHCGCCGRPMTGVFPKDWAWGYCSECSKPKVTYTKNRKVNVK